MLSSPGAWFLFDGEEAAGQLWTAAETLALLLLRLRQLLQEDPGSVPWNRQGQLCSSSVGPGPAWSPAWQLVQPRPQVWGLQGAGNTTDGQGKVGNQGPEPAAR